LLRGEKKIHLQLLPLLRGEKKRGCERKHPLLISPSKEGERREGGIPLKRGRDGKVTHL